MMKELQSLGLDVELVEEKSEEELQAATPETPPATGEVVGGTSNVG